MTRWPSAKAASLELRKLYVVLPDYEASKRKQLRVIDGSGEDDLYPIGAALTLRGLLHGLVVPSVHSVTALTWSELLLPRRTRQD